MAARLQRGAAAQSAAAHAASQIRRHASPRAGDAWQSPEIK
jgi:hypothetical protein